MSKLTEEQIAELQRLTLEAVDDLNGLVRTWQERGLRQEIICATFIGWLSAFAANGPTPGFVLNGIVDELKRQTADRRRARRSDA